MITDPARHAALQAVLEEARSAGFLGPGPVEPHIEHALAFVGDLAAPALALDLGSGAGVPGLALAWLAWPDSHWVLLDAGQRRAVFLAEAIEQLGLEDRVRVVRARAEEAGRDPELRATCDLVTSRGFGPPAVVAECAAPFLRVGGQLVVSEPPGGAPSRWPAPELQVLGLEPALEGANEAPSGPAMARFILATPCPDRYPRRVGIPAKRPLF